MEHCPPVLILAFNRPDTTARVFEALRAVKPRRIFFAVDGPRPEKADEAGRVAQVQALASTIDWPCDVQTLFRPRNLGCKHAVSQAITWFFQQVEEGIVVEDDCVPHPSFFPFAQELLERYRHDERVVAISGDNFLRGAVSTQYSYYFSRYLHIWGWASWWRAWRHYDHGMREWPELRERGWLTELLDDRAAASYWTQIFDDTHGERNMSWGYRWMYSAWRRGGLSINPCMNLVSNIGFGEAATHALQQNSPLASLPVEEMRFPLRHPPEVIRDESADRYTRQNLFSAPSRWRSVASRMRNLLRR
jgi:hypothetical protein